MSHAPMISNHTMVLMEVLCPMEEGEELCSDYDCCSSQPKGLCLSYAVEARKKLEEKK